MIIKKYPAPPICLTLHLKGNIGNIKQGQVTFQRAQQNISKTTQNLNTVLKIYFMTKEVPPPFVTFLGPMRSYIVKLQDDICSGVCEILRYRNSFKDTETSIYSYISIVIIKCKFQSCFYDLKKQDSIILDAAFE